MKLFFPNGERAPVDLIEGALVIGSSPTCEIMLDAAGVTSRHCELRTQGGRSEAGPLAIGAPTRLNGTVLTSYADLRGGDLLQIADVECRVVATERRKSPRIAQRPASVAFGDSTNVRMEAPTFVLRGVSGATFGKRFAIQGNMLVGRSNDCDICIPSEEISRHHVRLGLVPDGVMVEELGSANGTFINGRRMVGAALLKPGDELRIDVVRFLLIVPGKEAEHLTAAVDASAVRTEPPPRTRSKTLTLLLVALGMVVLTVVALFALGWSFLS